MNMSWVGVAREGTVTESSSYPHSGQMKTGVVIG